MDRDAGGVVDFFSMVEVNEATKSPGATRTALCLYALSQGKRR